MRRSASVAESTGHRQCVQTRVVRDGGSCEAILKIWTLTIPMGVVSLKNIFAAILPKKEGAPLNDVIMTQQDSKRLKASRSRVSEPRLDAIAGLRGAGGESGFAQQLDCDLR